MRGDGWWRLISPIQLGEDSGLAESGDSGLVRRAISLYDADDVVCCCTGGLKRDHTARCY